MQVPPAAGRPRVLIVDDEPLNRELLRRLLERQYELSEAQDGAAALEVLRACAVDVVIADQAMPNLSGAALLRQVRTFAPTTVGLLLTGFDIFPEIAAAQAEGAIFAVIIKPCRNEELRSQLERACVEAKARRSSG